MTAAATVSLVVGVVRGCGDTPPDAPVAAAHDTTAKNPAPEPGSPSPEPPVPEPAAPTPTPTETPLENRPVATLEPSKPVTPTPTSTPTPTPRPRPARASHPPLPPSPVVRVAVPALTIEAPVVGLGLDPGGRLATPQVDNPRLVGWYKDGPTPGEAGTSLLVGHRDTRTGPAIFLNLNALDPGDVINVAREDRRTAVFTVDAVRTYKKDAFPDGEVYGNKTGRPELRVLTCGGDFDKKTGYGSNVVVFAHLTDVKYA
ncbi:class F sortase [Streptomyces sp. Wb2n-11]|uniref:class F sortase n=1 Tax=Streptomyces sp. Wb2n-11 TaxID=1030533 RepID=UPI000B80B29F